MASKKPTPAPKPPACGLLVSVRNAAEAAIALAAGADLIDVKEPAKGPLGMAEHEVVAAVVAAVGGKVPVSAALGEFSANILTEAVWILELPLQYVKWGLAGYTAGPGWGEDILDARRQIPARTEVVAVAYADWQRAKSVPPLEVAKFAKRFRFRAFLLDTGVKDKKGLFDFIKPAELAEVVALAKAGGAKVAVGGSLAIEQVAAVRMAGPDWVAVRGGVCVGGRGGDLDAGRVAKWKAACG